MNAARGCSDVVEVRQHPAHQERDDDDAAAVAVAVAVDEPNALRSFLLTTGSVAVLVVAGGDWLLPDLVHHWLRAAMTQSLCWWLVDVALPHAAHLLALVLDQVASVAALGDGDAVVVAVAWGGDARVDALGLASRRDGERKEAVLHVGRADVTPSVAAVAVVAVQALLLEDPAQMVAPTHHEGGEDAGDLSSCAPGKVLHPVSLANQRTSQNGALAFGLPAPSKQLTS